MLNSLKLKTTLLTVICALSLGAQAGTEAPRKIDVPAGQLTTALKALAAQSGVEFVYSTDQLEGLRTNGVHGELTAEKAVAKLLEGTNLKVTMHESGALLIAPASSASAESAATTGALRGEPALRVAQAAGGDRTATNAPGDAAEKDQDQVGEVIVTATKRAQNIQDVPMSITAITGDEIERRGLVGAADYLRGIPGVNQVGSDGGYNGQAIVIRGIETKLEAQNFSSGPAVATYFGETPTTSTAGLLGSNIDIKLVDIERVEVLRGPQGTAFGSASMGGVVRTIPAAPKLDRFEAKVGAGYSATGGNGANNYNIQGVGNIPLIRDRLALRAAAYQYYDSGFYKNLGGSDPVFRSTVVVPYGAQAFAADEDEVGTMDTRGGRIAALFQATENLRLTASYLKQKTEGDGRPIADSGTYEQRQLQVAPEHVYRGQRFGLNDTEIQIANGTLEYDLGWSDLLATYSNISSSNLWAVPFTSIGYYYPGSSGGPASHHENNGEIRLSTKFKGGWNFLAGAYLEKLHDRYDYTVVWYGDPATDVFQPGARGLFDYLDQRDLEQRAAFGEVSWEFAPHFTLTGGVRAYEYDRTVAINQSGPLAGNVTTIKRDTIKTSGENFRANLAYKPSEAAMLYAGWSQGFRIGKPQPGVPAAVCDRDSDGIIDGTSVSIASTTALGPDSVDSYEVGGKFEFFDRRVSLDAAVFRMDWSEIPVAVRYASCNYLQSVNAGEARSQGVEMQARVRVSKSLQLDIGGSYIDAQLTEDVPAQGFVAGDRLPGSPKVNANVGLEQGFDIGARHVSVRADAIYVGAFFSDLLESPNTEAGDYVKLDLTGRLELGNLSLDLFIRNVTDEDSFVYRAGGLSPLYGYRLRPRTVGLQLGYNF